MSRRRFVPDSGVAAVDMLFNMMLFFFLTTVVSVKARTLADDVAVPGGDENIAPIVVRLESPPREETPGVFSLQSPGKHPAPAADAPIPQWLKDLCDAAAAQGDNASPVVVQIECTDHLTHAQCKRGVKELWQAAPACNYQY